ncbi:GIY-YIG nuclease family protein [Chitinolyticbacter meiyuanensis]|uniref:GIY-YIG nuclease family protein n=1 Tax=Chitinolyticbacter meiyuanensis TaxID=682798 RepID=UPI0011E5FA59|nr:GIY-YIG nuclease family protein [Chitinolyticbacter meiyuanensis]
MSYGFVYVLGNACMPGIYKVGMTDRAPMQRCRELSAATAAPMGFDLLFYIEVDEALKVEHEIHSLFAEERVNESREFFEVSFSRLIECLRDRAENYCMTFDGESEFQEEIYREEAAAIQARVGTFFAQEADPVHWPRFDDFHF